MKTLTFCYTLSLLQSHVQMIEICLSTWKLSSLIWSPCPWFFGDITLQWHVKPIKTEPSFGTRNNILIVWNFKLEIRWCKITSLSYLICFWLIPGTDLARASNTVCHDDFQGLSVQWKELDYTWKLYLNSTASSLCILCLLIWLKTYHFAPHTLS